ncbi:hypothetical protein [Tomitella biformata]|uniref:hypothetical protein n=1 Tax=Tomitella biformata TaxID=630403 RepID=UPI000571858C|nr:hypothetical protein [Tomitella biformata]
MTTNYERPWSRMSVDAKAALAANPSGPVPAHLVPRLMQLGVIGASGTYTMGSQIRKTANGDEYVISEQFATFVREQSL